MNLHGALAQLENNQLVRHLLDEDVAYMFKHALTQENAYQSLLQRQRREIHLRVAQAYEQLYADRLDEHAALLAQHYAQAGDDAKTFEYATRAGDVAARVHANVEAIAHYTRAIEIATRVETLPAMSLRDLYLKRGRLYELNAQYDLALANYAALETCAHERNDRALELAALMARATIYSIPTKQFDKTHAQALCDQALELAQAIGDQPAQAKILWNLLLVNTRLASNYHKAIAYGEQAVTIARTLDLREQLAYLLNDLSIVYVYDGKPERGEEVNLQARQMWREWNNLPMLADNLSYAAMVSIARAEYEQAIATAREAHEISCRIGNVWGEAFSYSWVGEAYRELGQIAQAIEVMQDSVRSALLGFQAPLAFTRGDLACLYGDLGMVARGIELARLAHAEGQKLAHLMNIWTSAQLIHLYLLDGQIAPAVALVNETRLYATPSDSASLFGVTIMLAEAELEIARADYPRAIQACDRLITTQRAHRLRQHLPQALFLRGIALQRQGELDQALTSLTDAQKEAEHVNSRWTLWRMLAALAEIEQARGNPSQAEALRAQARTILVYIADHTPDDPLAPLGTSLRASFLNLPDVRAIFTSA